MNTLYRKSGILRNLYSHLLGLGVAIRGAGMTGVTTPCCPGGGAGNTALLPMGASVAAKEGKVGGTGRCWEDLNCSSLAGVIQELLFVTLRLPFTFENDSTPKGSGCIGGL